jgi:hypothetical protein
MAENPVHARTIRERLRSFANVAASFVALCPAVAALERVLAGMVRDSIWFVCAFSSGALFVLLGRRPLREIIFCVVPTLVAVIFLFFRVAMLATEGGTIGNYLMIRFAGMLLCAFIGGGIAFSARELRDRI